MKRNKILSSAFVMTMVSFGAFAADGKITGGAGTCTVDMLGVFENDATANTIATWDLKNYECGAGQYLNITDNTVECTECPTGSYCPGGTYTVESDNKGTNACPTGYPNSANGASADTQCYTACTVANANIAHATEVSGNDYYGSGVDTCGATACETGYHVDGGGLELVEKTPLVPISLTDAGAGYRYVRADGTSYSYDNVDAIPADSVTAPNTWATAYSEGAVYGKASCQPKADPAYDYVMSNMESIFSGSKSMETVRSELTALSGPIKAEAMIGYLEIAMTNGGEGMAEEDVFEKGAKFHVVYSESSDKNYSTDSVGQYCYCQMDGFMPTGGTREIVTSAPWLFYGGGSADECADLCVKFCADNLRYDDVSSLAFRAVAVGALDAVETGGICAANTINIDWNPDNGGEHTKNMCTYDGSITLPTPDPVKPGYTFTGWKLVDGTTTE